MDAIKLITQSITNMVFTVGDIGFQSSNLRKIEKTNPAKGMPTNAIPVMHAKTILTGEVEIKFQSLIKGSQLIKAAPPPKTIEKAAIIRAKRTIIKTNSTGQNTIASNTSNTLIKTPTTCTNASPNFCKAVRGLPEFT